jgi:hypothetical protein
VTLEGLKSFFEYGGVVLLFLTFVFGAGAVITANLVNKRQARELRQFDRDLTDAKTRLADQEAETAREQERAAKAEKDLLSPFQ